MSKILVGIIITLALALTYKLYESSKKDQIIKDKDMVIAIQAGNIKSMEKMHLDNINREIFNEVSKEKKRSIEKEISYDKNSSVDINSTRFYL